MYYWICNAKKRGKFELIFCIILHKLFVWVCRIAKQTFKQKILRVWKIRNNSLHTGNFQEFHYFLRSVKVCVWNPSQTTELILSKKGQFFDLTRFFSHVIRQWILKDREILENYQRVLCTDLALSALSGLCAMSNFV